MKKFILLLIMPFYSFAQDYNMGDYKPSKTQPSAPLPVLSVPYIPRTPIDYDAIDARIARRQAIIDEAAARDRAAVIECASQTNALYQNFNSRSATLADGWYKVRATDNVSMCGERIVFVQNERVTRYFVNGIYERLVQLSSKIEKGVAVVKVGDGAFVNCYFLDNLLDSNAHATEPEFGLACFYTNNVKLKGPIVLSIDDEPVGKISGYYADGVPTCNQQYTVTITRRPGIYNYSARDEKHSWQGTFEIKNGLCYPYLLFVK